MPILQVLNSDGQHVGFVTVGLADQCRVYGCGALLTLHKWVAADNGTHLACDLTPTPERCPVCGQPDNCGDCNHSPIGDSTLTQVKAFVATINTPGCLPEAEPVECDTATEAWLHLLDEYVMAWNDAPIPGGPDDPLPPALIEVYNATCAAFASSIQASEPGHIAAPTPGRELGDEGDLGLVYEVTAR